MATIEAPELLRAKLLSDFSFLSDGIILNTLSNMERAPFRVFSICLKNIFRLSKKLFSFGSLVVWGSVKIWEASSRNSKEIIGAVY